MKIIICDNSRLVEKYDFILKYDDKWLDLVVDVCDIECYDFFNKVVDLLEIDLIVSRKRKRIYKERRLVKERIRIDNLRKFKEFLFDLEVEKIVKMIVKKLNEFKDYFFGRKVNILLYIYYINILGYNCIFCNSYNLLFLMFFYILVFKVNIGKKNKVKMFFRNLFIITLIFIILIGGFLILCIFLLLDLFV